MPAVNSPNRDERGLSPAYRIETERTLLRCWQPEDAPLLLEAVSSSLDHLRPWMPWAEKEPTPLHEKVALLRRWRGRFDLDEDYTFAVFSPDERTVLGSAGLHKRLSGNALEIGYWIRADRINRGLATEISAALSKIAFLVYRVDRVEIHCDPANVRSAAIPRKLGFLHEALLRRRVLDAHGVARDTDVWTLFRDDLPDSPVSDSNIRVYDARGCETPLT